METPVLRKVQGKTAEVLRKESWPGPEKGKSWRKERGVRISELSRGRARWHAGRKDHLSDDCHSRGLTGPLDKGALDGVVWPKDTTGAATCAGAEPEAPGPWMGGAGPSARLDGGWGGLAGVVTGVVTGVHTPFGDDVPPTDTPGTSSPSPWLCDTPPPRSMKSDRSFISSAWMSSGLPCDSAEASHLEETRETHLVLICYAQTGGANGRYIQKS